VLVPFVPAAPPPPTVIVYTVFGVTDTEFEYTTPPAPPPPDWSFLPPPPPATSRHSIDVTPVGHVQLEVVVNACTTVAEPETKPALVENDPSNAK
jgi:hypothetical protein